MPQLVIVRPGLFYVIRIGPFLRPHHCNSYKLLRRVNMRCGIVVNFYDSNADEDTGACRNDDDTDEDDSGSSSDDDDDDDGDGDDDEMIGEAGPIRGLGFNQIQM